MMSDRTFWVFISGSTDEWHINDVIYGYYVLRRKGVPDSRIAIFTHFANAASYLNQFNMGGAVFDTADLPTTLSRLVVEADCDQVVVAVTGHGGHKGICSGQDRFITVHEFINSIRSVNTLKSCVAVLSQCYAGVFNYIDATGEPEFVLMGATALEESLSFSLELNSEILKADGTPGLKGWLANIFFFYFFEWINFPEDVDGDGSLTALDAYRSAGVKSNFFLQSRQSRITLELNEHMANQAKLVTTLLGLPVEGSPGWSSAVEQARAKLGAELSASNSRLRMSIKVLHINQEPWFLHTDLGRRTTF